jgi:hypothetical protein
MTEIEFKIKWILLPKVILGKIFEFLKIYNDYLYGREVCTNWKNIIVNRKIIDMEKKGNVQCNLFLQLFIFIFIYLQYFNFLFIFKDLLYTFIYDQ